MVCSWFYQPSAHIIAPEFHLHILSGRSSEPESPRGCGLDLKHSRMSKVAHSYCFAVRSVAGLGNTKLKPVPPLGTISCPSYEEGSPCLPKLIVHVFVLLPGYCDWFCTVKFPGFDCSIGWQSPFPTYAWKTFSWKTSPAWMGRQERCKES